MLDQVVGKLSGTRVDIREVGLREGLQSHQLVLPTDVKVELFRGLADAGLKEINAVAFVNPAKMPHMGDTEDLLRAIAPYRAGIDISGVAFSEGRLNKAIAMHEAGHLDTIFLVYSPVASSMTANGIVADTEALLAQIERCAARAAEAGLRVEVFVSESFGSPVEGWIDPERVISAAQRIRTMKGVSGLIISDSTGQADPVQVLSLFTRLAGVLPTDERLTFHIHDSRGAGMANAVAALMSPFRHFCIDSSFGGLGGDFPFVPDAFGNVATEDLVEMLTGMGFETGVDADRIVAVARRYAEISNRPLGSRLSGCAHSQKWKRSNRLINPVPAAA
jgi:isopropylmalate/homocitrate/citramalate synthase